MQIVQAYKGVGKGWRRSYEYIYGDILQFNLNAHIFCGDSLCGQGTLKKEIPGQKTLGSIQNNPVRVDVLFCRGVRCISL